MKKLIILFLIALSINYASAQHFGIKGGLNLAKIKASSEGISVSFDNLITFHAGFVYDTPISDNFYFNTGVLFSQKGFKFGTQTVDGSIDVKLKLNYIQVPLNFAIKTDVGNAKLFAQAGPFLAIAISGKGEGSITGLGSGSGDVEFGAGEYEYKRLDAGLGLGAGVELEKVQLSINYDFGLVDIQNVSDSKTNTRTLQFSACYLF